MFTAIEGREDLIKALIDHPKATPKAKVKAMVSTDMDTGRAQPPMEPPVQPLKALLMEWHHWLGYIIFNRIHALAAVGQIAIIDKKEQICEPCKLGKAE